jgi:nucleoporin SEH1
MSSFLLFSFFSFRFFWGGCMCARTAPVRQATISTDGHLRIYTSLSPTLSDWQLTTSVHVPTLGLGDPATAAQQSTSTWSIGQDEAAAAGGSGGGGGGGLMTPNTANTPLDSIAGTYGKNNEAFGCWDLSCVKESWWGLLVAVGCGHGGVVKVSQIQWFDCACLFQAWTT